MIHHHWYEFIMREKEEEMRRDLKQRQLLQAAGIQPFDNWTLPRKLTGWLGVQMVKWGSKLQSIAQSQCLPLSDNELLSLRRISRDQRTKPKN